MNLKKELRKSFITDKSGIKRNLYRFSMSGLPAANLFIGWMVNNTASIPGSDRKNPVELRKVILDSPETEY